MRLQLLLLLVVLKLLQLLELLVLLQLMEVRGHETARPGRARTRSGGRRGCGAVHWAGQREAAPRPRLGDVEHRRVGWSWGPGGRGHSGAGVGGGRGSC